MTDRIKFFSIFNEVIFVLSLLFMAEHVQHQLTASALSGTEDEKKNNNCESQIISNGGENWKKKIKKQKKIEKKETSH